jgi:hypothetical protein
VQRTINDRSRGWLAERERACRAVPRSTSDEQGVRIECLDRQLGQLRATLDHLVGIRSASRLANAARAVQDLPYPDDCESTERLVKGERLPTEIEARHQLKLISDRLDDAFAEWNVEENPAVLEVATRAALDAAKFAPLKARALKLVGLVQRTRADAAVVQTVREARIAAAEAGDDILQAELLIALADTNVIVAMAPQELEWMLREVEARIAAIRRVSPREADRLQFFYLISRGTAALLEHKPEVAVTQITSAIESGTQVYGAASWRLARARGTLGLALSASGQLHKGYEEVAATLPVIEKYLGPDHLELANQCHLASGAAYFEGDLRQALALSQRALAIAARAGMGNGRIELVDLHAEIQLSMRDFGAALQTLEVERVLGEHAPPTPAVNPQRIRAKIDCAVMADGAAAMTEGPARDRRVLAAAECFQHVQMPRPAVALLEPTLASTTDSTPDALHIRLRFALATALWERSQDGDEQRAIDEARRARRACDRVPGLAETASEIDAWLREVTTK